MGAWVAQVIPLLSLLLLCLPKNEDVERGIAHRGESGPFPNRKAVLCVAMR